jgi:hypothetical protein
MDIEILPPLSLLTTKLCIASGAGILSHHFVFKRGEWHMQAPYLVCFSAVSIPILAAVEELGFDGGNIARSFSAAVLILLSFVCTLFTSIIIYRLYFHRLRDFPGPKIAAATKLWHAYYCLDGKNYLFLQRLRAEYGDFVRTGIYCCSFR